MSMDLTAKDLVIIIDKALENYYDEIGGRILEEPFERDGSHACCSTDQLKRHGFNEDFDMDEFIDRLKEDVDFTAAIKERLDYAF